MVDTAEKSAPPQMQSKAHAAAPQRGSIVGPLLIALAIIAGAALAATIVGSKVGPTKSGSAPAGTVNTDKAHVIRMPGGYSNVATKCSGVPKQRLWVSSGSGRAFVTQDPRC
ncbi:MAG TPA: hypothetical protein VM030_11780 [Acidimicrobiales bacterium]|nr:hypothetical protein [Acidimicrobiales bacterium]